MRGAPHGTKDKASGPTLASAGGMRAVVRRAMTRYAVARAGCTRARGRAMTRDAGRAGGMRAVAAIM